MNETNETLAPSATPQWAVLVYIAADVPEPGMHWAARRNLEQILDTGSSAHVSVAAQIDSPGKPTRRYVFPSRPSGGDTWTVRPAMSLANINSADARSLTSFFAWGLNACPAKNTMLVLWGHGYGLHAAFKDEAANQVLTNRRLGEALRACQSMAKQRDGNLAILGLNCCRMSMAEVWCEIAGSAPIGIASQAGLPYTSWPFDAFLTRLHAAPHSDPKTVAGMLLDSFTEFYRERDEYVTMSVCDLERLDDLQARVRPLSEALASVAADPEVRKGFFSARASCPVYDSYGYIDLDCFCGFLETDVANEAVRQACRPVREELRRFVIASTYAPQDTSRMISLSMGLSVWLPPWLEGPSVAPAVRAKTESYLRTGYGYTRFSAATKWGDLLKALAADHAVNTAPPDARAYGYNAKPNATTPATASEEAMEAIGKMGGRQDMGGHNAMGGRQVMGGHQGMGGHTVMGGHASMGGHMNMGGHDSMGGHQDIGGHHDIGGHEDFGGHLDFGGHADLAGQQEAQASASGSPHQAGDPASADLEINDDDSDAALQGFIQRRPPALS